LWILLLRSFTQLDETAIDGGRSCFFSIGVEEVVPGKRENERIKGIIMMLATWKNH
jgi:hypothetical protein